MKKLFFLTFILSVCLAATANAQCVTSPSFGCSITGTYAGFAYQKISGANIAATNMIAYNGGDAPRGGWIRNATEPATGGISFTSQINLAGAITTGIPHYIFFSILGYDHFNTVECTLGGATSNTITIQDRSPANLNHPWQAKMTVTPVSSAGSPPKMSCTFHENGDGYIQVLLTEIYITTDSTLVMNGDSFAVNLTEPVSTVTTIVAGNQIKNGSLEAGLDAQFGLSVNKVTDPATLWSCTAAAAHTGNCGMAIPVTAASYATGVVDSQTTISHRVMHLKPNQRYKAGVWAKFNSGSESCALFVSNTYLDSDGQPIYIFEGTGFSGTVTTSWTFIGDVGYAKKWPESDYTLSLSCNAPSGATTLYVDDWFLDEDPSATYSEGLALTCLLSTSVDGNIFLDTDDFTLNYRCLNSTGSPITEDIQYTIRSADNSLVLQSSQSVTVGAGATETGSFTPAVSKLGPLTVAYWINDVNDTDRELNVARVKAYALSSGLDATSSMGLHPTIHDWQLSKWQRLGFKWFRALSPTSFAQAAIVAPSSATSVTFYDTAVNAVQSRGMKILMPIFCSGSETCPVYMRDGMGRPDPATFGLFAKTVIAHYCALMTPVTYYEIFNEPPFSATHYADVLKEVISQSYASCPTMKIVAGALGGGNQSGWPAWLSTFTARMDSVCATCAGGSSWRTVVPATSIHNYPGGAPQENASAILLESMQAWNTETSCVDNGSYRGPYANFTVPGAAYYPYQASAKLYSGLQDCPNILTQNFSRSLGAGQSKYFYYTAQLFQNPTQGISNWTIQSYDGSVSAKGIAYSLMGSFLDHATLTGRAGTGANLFYVFDNSGAVAVLYRSDNAPYQITLSGVNSDYGLYDLYRNAKPFSTTNIPYGREPVFLTCTCNAATLFARLSVGTVAARTDTTAPNLSIIDGPRAAIDGYGSFRMRWIAIDKERMPTLGTAPSVEGAPLETANPEAILYRYKLSGDSFSDWSQDTYADYSGVADGSYVFTVEAKDLSGNTTSATWHIGEDTIPVPAPTVTSMNPTAGRTSATVNVTITGTNFATGNTSVSVSGTGVTVSNVVVVSSTSITAVFTVASNATLGNRTVTVTTNGGSATTTFSVQKLTGHGKKRGR